MATEEVIIQVRTRVDDTQLKQLEAELTRIGQQAQAGAGGVSQFETEVRKTNQTTQQSSNSTKQFSENVKKGGDTAGSAAPKIKKAGDETRKAGNNARTASNNFGIMSGAMSMIGGMVFYDLAAGVMESAQASLQGRQQLQAYGQMLGMTKTEISSYQQELAKLQQTYKKVDMNVVGSQVQQAAKMYGLGKDNLGELAEMYAVAASAFQMNGRSQKDSVLAVNDALDGEFRRLKEIGISQDLLKANGWNGDLQDKKSLIDALNKSLQQRGFADFAQNITSSSEAMAALKMSIGQLVAVLFDQLSPLLIPVAMGVYQVVSALTAFLQTPAGSQIASIVVGFAGVAVGAYGVARAVLAARNAYRQMKEAIQIVTNGLKGLGWITNEEVARKRMETLEIDKNTAAQNRNSAARKGLLKRIASGLKTMLLSIANFIKDTAVKIANAVATYALAIAQWLLASPILIVVIAVIALIAIMWYLYNTNETVRAGIDWLIQTLWNFLTTAWSVITGAISILVSWAQQAWAWLQNAWSAFMWFVNILRNFPNLIWQIFASAIMRVIQFGLRVISQMKSSATNSVNGFINGMKNLASGVWNELMNTLNKVIEWGGQIVSKFSEIAQQAWNAFISGLGIGSPGYIQILTLKELSDTADRIPESMPTAIRNLENYASGMVEAYGVPEFPVANLTTPTVSSDGIPSQVATTNNGGDIIVNNYFNIGSVDNEDRVDEIADIITRILTFNNITAGRTV